MRNRMENGKVMGNCMGNRNKDGVQIYFGSKAQSKK